KDTHRPTLLFPCPESNATPSRRPRTPTVSPKDRIKFLLHHCRKLQAASSLPLHRGFVMAVSDQPRNVPPVAFSTCATSRRDRPSISASVNVASCGCSTTEIASDFLPSGSPLPS